MILCTSDGKVCDFVPLMIRSVMSCTSDDIKVCDFVLLMIRSVISCTSDDIQVYCQVTACYANNCRATTGEPVQSNIIHFKLEVGGFCVSVCVQCACSFVIDGEYT